MQQRQACMSAKVRRPKRHNYHLLAKSAGAACNLGCQYCFFLSKENLYGERESPLMTRNCSRPTSTTGIRPRLLICKHHTSRAHLPLL